MIGAGEMGKLTALHMKSHGVHTVTIVSRTMAHAARTAEAIGGASAAPWDELDAVLGAADIVITATGAAAPILTKAHIEAVMRPRRNRPLFVIDIAVPRDVEPAAGEIEQVFLYNIDDLQATVRENLARRSSEVARAEAIVGEEVDKFAAWLRSRGAIPTVVALRQRFEAIRRAELERLEFKLSSLPPGRARARVDEITHLIIEKLLLTPTEQLKSLGDSDTVGAYAEALTRLFDLSDAAASSARDVPNRASRTLDRIPNRQGRAVPAQPIALAALTLLCSGASTRHARQPARALAGQYRGGAHRRCRRTALPHRRHQDLGRSAAGRAALGNRRQAAVREGNRRRAARRRDRPRRPQQQGHAGASARAASPSAPCCRARIRSTRWCCRSGLRA